MLYVETEILRERASIARRPVFARMESFSEQIVFAANSRNFYPTFKENFVFCLETFQVEEDYYLIWKMFTQCGHFSDCLENFPDYLESFQIV